MFKQPRRRSPASRNGSGSWATNPFAKKGINYASLIPLEWEEGVNPMVGSQEWCTRVKITKRE